MGQFVIVGIFLVGMCAFVWTLIAQEAAGGAGFGRPSWRRSLAARWDALDLARRLRRRIGTLDLLTRALAVGTKIRTFDVTARLRARRERPRGLPVRFAQSLADRKSVV